MFIAKWNQIQIHFISTANQKVLSTVLLSKRANKDMVSRQLLYFIGLKKA